MPVRPAVVHQPLTIKIRGDFADAFVSQAVKIHVAGIADLAG